MSAESETILCETKESGGIVFQIQFFTGVHKPETKESHNDDHNQQYQENHQNLLLTLLVVGTLFGLFWGFVRALDQLTIFAEGIGSPLQDAVGHLRMNHVLSFDDFSAGTDIINTAIDFNCAGMKRLIVAIIDQLTIFFE